MKFLKSHFALSKSQQNGIFVLVLLIIGFQVFLFFDFTSNSEIKKIDRSEIDKFQKQLDSVNQTKSAKNDTIYPFNPNYITDFKGYQLGMSVAEIDRLLTYRQSGKWINSTSEFQTITRVSDSLLQKISPSFRFPQWTQQKNSKVIQSGKDTVSEIKVLDMNTATAEDFKLVNGVGEVLSHRIVKYRHRIGGFLSSIQLKDVYGLSPEVIERIEKKFEIRSKPDIAIKNLNLVTEAELSNIPYFNNELAKQIISYRKLNEGISTFEELSKIKAFPHDKIDRIKLYLVLK